MRFSKQGIMTDYDYMPVVKKKLPQCIAFLSICAIFSGSIVLFDSKRALSSHLDNADQMQQQMVQQQMQQQMQQQLEQMQQRSQGSQGQYQIVTSNEATQESASSSSETADHHSVTIFYNIYIPPDNPEASQRAYDIVKEQMEQVAEATNTVRNTAIASAANTAINLHYVTIGEEFDNDVMNELCRLHQLSSCVHQSHHDEGYEMITQQLLLEHCQQDYYQNDVVAYIHNKGSLHDYEAQHSIRRRLTKYALSPQCLEELTGTAAETETATDSSNTSYDSTNQNSCNVCGANFKSVWGPTLWGNMWSAKCNYVSNLVSPFDLDALNQKAVDTKPPKLTRSLYDNDQNDVAATNNMALGQGRFAAEQFVSTHPSLIPCSFSKPEDASNAFWKIDPPGKFLDYVIQGGTKPNLESVILNIHDAQDPLNKSHLHEWYLLPGILWRYHVLYDALPPDDSWIWRHYPDGERWKEVIDEMGFPEALYHRMDTET